MPRMAQNEMKAMCGMPLRVRSMEGLGVMLSTAGVRDDDGNGCADCEPEQKPERSRVREKSSVGEGGGTAKQKQYGNDAGEEGVLTPGPEGDGRGC